MLNDEQIKQLADEVLLINPFEMGLLQPHSYDATLDLLLKIPSYTKIINEQKLCVGNKKEWQQVSVEFQQLQPLQFALGSTIEYFKLPQNVVGFVQGKSTVGRNGLQIECAGLIDAGFEGNITLELFNMAPWPIELKYHMPICQIHFCYVDSPVYKNYKKIGSYNGQTGTTEPIYKL